jgi:uncharacterized protein YkwD
MNAARAEHHVAPLAASTQLAAAANYHSHEMLRAGYFSHDSASGGSPDRRIGRFYPSSGYRTWRIGEALLWWATTVDDGGHPRLARKPEHRAILLSSSFR